MPDLEVTYVSESATGLFEQAREHYGEVRYALAGRTRHQPRHHRRGRARDDLHARRESRRARVRDDAFRGHPLEADPHGAGWMFYGTWPALVLVTALAIGRRES